MPKYCFPLVVFVSFWLVRCSDRQEAPVQTATVATADTVGVSAMVDTAYMFLRDSQVEQAMEQMKKVFEICQQAKITGYGQKMMRDVIVEAAKQKQLTSIYQTIDWAIQSTKDSVQYDTIGGKLFNLKGYLLHEEGKFYAANVNYESALQKLPAQQFRLFHLRLYTNISQLYIQLGDYPKGEEYAFQGLRFADESVFEVPVSFIINTKREAFRDIGWANYELNNNDKAIQYFRRALLLTPDEQKSDIFTFISKCHLNASRADSAFHYARTAIDWAHRYPEDISWEADAKVQLARCYLFTNQFKEAESAFVNALSVSTLAYNADHPDFYKIFVYLGIINYNKQQEEKAIAFFEKAVSMSISDKHPAHFDQILNASDLPAEYFVANALSWRAQILTKLALAHKTSSEVKAALNSIDLVLSANSWRFKQFSSDAAKIETQGNSIFWYEQGIKLALMSKDTIKASDYIINSKSALLKEQIEHLALLKGTPDSISMTYNLLKQEIAANEGALKRGEYISEDYLLQLKFQADRLKHQILTSAPESATRYSQSDLIELTDIRNLLPPNTVLLEFFYGDSSLYLLAVNRETNRVFKISDPHLISGKITELLENIDVNAGTGFSQKFGDASSFLYLNLLQEPLKLAALEANHVNRLWIIPDGPLFYLPFAALLTDGPANKSSYILKKYALGYAYTFSQFFQQKDTNTHLTADYGGWGISYDSFTLKTIKQPPQKIASVYRDFGPLYQTQKEIIGSSKALDAKNWFDQDVSKESFVQNAGKFRICHLAMHAISDVNDPEKSKLVFSANPSDPQSNKHFLYASEIYGLHIPAELVVLSACNTANGQVTLGEGVMSIGRAFHYAGAQSVLMTQWSLNDNAAADVVPEFFAYLRQGQPKDIALQKAQLAVLERMPHQSPVYWAGFIVSGNANPVELKPVNNSYKWLLLITGFAMVMFILKFKVSPLRA